MPKLIIVKNPLMPEEIMTFSCKEREMIPFIHKFLLVNPEYWNVFKNTGFSIRINDILIDDPLCALKLSLQEDDNIVFFPDIEVTGSAFMAGLTAGAVGTAGAGFTLATLATLVGQTILGMAISYGINALFGPNISSPKGPAEGSPNFTWNIKPTSREGVAIPVVYGETLVGGNVISSSKEYVLNNPWFWSGGISEQPILTTIPNVDIRAIGITQPIRGIQANFQGYGKILFFWYLVWQEDDYNKFWEGFFELFNTEGYLWNGDVIKGGIQTSLTNGLLVGIRSKEVELAGQIQDSIDTGGLTPERLEELFGQLVNPTQEYFESDFIYVEAGASANRIAFIQECIWFGVQRAKDGASKPVVESTWLSPGEDNFTLIFDTYKFDEQNLGLYVIGAFFQESTVSELMNLDFDDFDALFGPAQSEWWPLSNRIMFYELYLSDKVWFIEEYGAGIDFVSVPKTFVVSKVLKQTYSSLDGTLQAKLNPETDPGTVETNQHIHQLIALSEGTCANVEAVYVNDMISTSISNFQSYLYSGSNTQYLGAGAENPFKEYNYAKVFHGRNEELVDIGHYVDFVTTTNFGATNVILEISTAVYTVSSEGDMTEPIGGPLVFSVLIGWEGVADFTAYSGSQDPTQEEMQNGNFLHWKYTVTGQGQTNAQVHKYPVLPITDFEFSAEYISATLLSIPNTAMGACAWLNLLFDGELYDHQRYKDQNDSTYHDMVNLAISTRWDEYFNTDRKSLKVRVYRHSPPYDPYRRQGDRSMYVTGFQEVAYQGTEYVNTALLGVELKASNKFNSSAPKITTLLRGKIILVPKLVTNVWNVDLQEMEKVQVYHASAWYDEDVGRYRSHLHNGNLCTYAKDDNNQYVWVEEWTDNPVWCLYDIIISKRYGLGHYTDQLNLPVDWFIEAAEYCDTMVPDGEPRVAENIDVDILVDRTTNFIKDATPFYRENYPGLVGEESGVGESQNPLIADKIIYYKKILGGCVFAKTSDGNWTRAVVQRIQGVVPSEGAEPDDRLGATPGLVFNRAYMENLQTGSTYWTNQEPAVSEETNFGYYQLGEKRYTLNIAVDNQTSAIDWLKIICDTFRAFPMWLGSGYKPIIDRAQNPIKTIGMGNIIKDSFQLAYVPLSESFNVLKAQFINRENRYSKETRAFVDSEVDKITATEVQNTIREKTVSLLGITRPSQLDRELAYLLKTSKYNKRIISFGMGVEYLELTAGDVFSFNHIMMLETSVSGRIMGYGTAGGEFVVLDQDVSTLTEPLILRVSHTIADANLVNGIEMGSEVVGEYTVISVDGNKVYATFGETKPANFNTYELGEASESVYDYRIIDVAPQEGGIANLTAVSYLKSVHGDLRTTMTGGITAYDNANLIYVKKKTLRIIRSLNVTLQVTNLDIKEVTLWIISSLSPEVQFQYLNSTVSIINEEQVLIDTLIIEPAEGESGKKVILPNYNILYTFRVTPNYSDGISGTVVVKTITLSIGNGDDDLGSVPGNVSNFRLSPKCRPRVEFANDDYNYFVTDYLNFLWDGLARSTEEGWVFSTNEVTIAGFKLTLYFKDSRNPDVWILAGTYLLGRYETNKKVELYNLMDTGGDDLALSSSEALAYVVGVKTSIVAFTELGKESEEPTVEEFYPQQPTSPGKVKIHDLFSNVFIWWDEQDDWENVERFDVTLTVRTTVDDILVWDSGPLPTNDHNIMIRIPSENLVEVNSIGYLWGMTFSVKIQTITKVGSEVSPIVSYPVVSIEQLALEDYMIGSNAQHINVYDKVMDFDTDLTVAEHRIENYTTDWQTRQDIIELYQGDPITYSGTANGITELWSTGPVASSRIDNAVEPRTDSSQVYTGNDNNELVCRVSATGDEVWTFDDSSALSAPVTGSVAVDGTNVYFAGSTGSYVNNLYKVNASTGVKVWDTALFGTTVIEPTTPIIISGYIYIGSGNYFYCIDSSGSIVWTYIKTGTEYFVGTPVVNGTVILIGGANGTWAIDSDITPMADDGSGTGARLLNKADYGPASNKIMMRGNTGYYGTDAVLGPYAPAFAPVFPGYLLTGRPGSYLLTTVHDRYHIMVPTSYQNYKAFWYLNGRTEKMTEYIFQDWTGLDDWEDKTKNVNTSQISALWDISMWANDPAQLVWSFQEFDASCMDGNAQRAYLYMWSKGGNDEQILIGYIDVSDISSPYMFYVVAFSDNEYTRDQLRGTQRGTGGMCLDNEGGYIVLTGAYFATDGLCVVFDKTTGVKVRDWTYTSSDFPNKGVGKSVAKNGKIYGPISYDVGEPTKYGLCELDISDGSITYYKPTYAGADHTYEFGRPTIIDADTLVMAHDDYGIVKVVLSTNTWTVFNDTNVPYMYIRPGPTGFPGSQVAYEPDGDLYMSYERDANPLGALMFHSGETSQTYYMNNGIATSEPGGTCIYNNWSIGTNWVGEISYDSEERMLYIIHKRVTSEIGVTKVDIDTWQEVGYFDSNSNSAIIEYDFTEDEYTQLQIHQNSAWSVLTPQDVAVSDEHIVFANTPDSTSGETGVWGIDRSDGSAVWGSATGENYLVNTSVRSEGGKAYFGTRDSKIKCVEMETGVEVWNHNTTAQVNAITIDTDNTGYIFAGCEDGNLYALGYNMNVARITYESAVEEEFTRMYFTSDKSCKVWIEYLHHETDGSFLYGDWDYLGGDATNSLDANGNLTSYATSALAKGNYWQCTGAGVHVAKFLTPLLNKWVRLIVSANSGTSIDISDVRFVRAGTFEEELPDITADSIVVGDITADTANMDLIQNITFDTDEQYIINANASGEEYGQHVAWFRDLGVGGTYSSPLVSFSSSGEIYFSGENFTASKSLWLDANDQVITKDILTTDITSIKRSPDSLAFTTGSLTSGELSNVNTLNNVPIEITEASGAPGQDFEFTFDSVEDFSHVGFSMYYAGGGTHYVEAGLWNETNSRYDLLTTVTNLANYNHRYVGVPNEASEYLSGETNKVKMRFYHPTTGNASHNTYIDYLYLKTSD